MNMGKTTKSAIVTIRMLPAEKQAAEYLADKLGLKIADVIRLSLNETLQKKNGQIVINFPTVINNQGEQNG
jgi:antitoxin component of RelBE/YafQ-DinJ toxin-antitoxin module